MFPENKPLAKTFKSRESTDFGRMTGGQFINHGAACRISCSASLHFLHSMYGTDSVVVTSRTVRKDKSLITT
jgi:hypothetical protein